MMPTLESKPVKLFRNGRRQAVRIPKEFALPGTEAIISRDKLGRLILTPSKKTSLSSVLARMSPGGPSDTFPDIEDFLADPFTIG